MIPYFAIDHFMLGPFRFYTWGFFIALAFLVGMILAIWQAKKIGISSEKIIWLIIFVYLGAMVGGRLFFIFQSPLEFLREPSLIFHVSGGGMMFYGGLALGAAAGFLYLRSSFKKSPLTPPKGGEQKLPPFREGWGGFSMRILLNSLAPIIPLAMAIGRIGCFLNNDHQGAITNVPWGILWPDGTLRHPVALYLILFDLILAGVLWWHNKVPPFVKGGVRGILNTKINPPQPSFTKGGRRTVLLFRIFYPRGRLFLDFTRDASTDPHFFSLASSQWISLTLLTIVLLYYIIKRKYRGNVPKILK